MLHCSINPGSLIALVSSPVKLTFANPGMCDTRTGSWLAERGIACTCVCGRSVRGNSEAEKKTFPRYAFNSYEMLCGLGNGVEGDCIIPLQSAFME
eukprot:scaffold176704_cov34-Prasinocladus_malaysianus.AAC.1